jgi:hypothetical protein
MSISLTEATILRDATKEAYLAALASQQYSKGDRANRRADLAVLAAELMRWEKIVQRLENGGGIRITGATPV